MPERMQDRVGRPAEQLADLVLSRPPSAGGVRVLALDGPSGSGKSTLAGLVVQVLAQRAGGGAGSWAGSWAGEAGDATALLRLDDVYPGWDGLDDAAATVAQLLDDLAAHRPARYRTWDWEDDDWGPEVAVVPPAAGGVLVVEGSGCGSRAAGRRLSALAWVEADDAVRYERAMARDGEGYRPHWERWAAQERSAFAAEGTRERADVVVST